MGSVVDAARVGAYYSMINAQVQVGKKDWSKVTKGQPEPIFAEKIPKQVATVRARDAKAMLERIVLNKKLAATRAALRGG